MKGILSAAERKFPHYLTTGRLQRAIEGMEKFDYVPTNFFSEFRFTPINSDNDEESESEDDEDLERKNADGESSTSTSGTATAGATPSESNVIELLTQINTSQQQLSKRLQKVESKVGVIVSPLKVTDTQQRDETLQPRKIDLMSPPSVKIETQTGDAAFNDITTFRLFDDTYHNYMLQMEGITKNPSANKRRKIDAGWCLERLALKFGIGPSDSSAPVLKEHVAHMATVTHLFKHHSKELRKGNFKDPALVPMKRKRDGC